MSLDWTNALAANGPAVAAWIDDHHWELDDCARRRLSDWRRGGQASFHALDRVLTARDAHPCLLPDDVWEQPIAKTGRSRAMA